AASTLDPGATGQPRHGQHEPGQNSSTNTEERERAGRQDHTNPAKDAPRPRRVRVPGRLSYNTRFLDDEGVPCCMMIGHVQRLTPRFNPSLGTEFRLVPD